MPNERPTPPANPEAADAGRHRPDTDSAGAPRIDPQDEGSVQTWAKKLDTTPDQIREAVGRVGPRADEVELDLKGSRSTTNSERTGGTGGEKGNG